MMPMAPSPPAFPRPTVVRIGPALSGRLRDHRIGEALTEGAARIRAAVAALRGWLAPFSRIEALWR